MVKLTKVYIVKSDIEMLNKVKSLLLDFEVDQYEDDYSLYKDFKQFIDDLQELERD